MYKLEVYKEENNNLYLTHLSKNLSCFDKYKNKCNYKIKIYKKRRKWELIYDETVN